MSHSRIISTSAQDDFLESNDLARLEQAFRTWATKAGPARALSRKRILVMFLLIRYTGAKLHEVTGLHAESDILPAQGIVRYQDSEEENGQAREVHISPELADELANLLEMTAAAPEMESAGSGRQPFAIDPAFVRRKFYERAKECGLDARRGGPEMIRKARALEMMRNNIPLPVVQRFMGHSTPGITAARVSFSEEDMQQVARWFIERESGRKTSARNNFFGKATRIAKGEIQSLVEITTPDGDTVRTMVTNSSVERLGLREGRLVAAEIKAPWLMLESASRPGASSADNVYEGRITKIGRGSINTECEVSIHEGITLCAVLSTPGFDALGLVEGDAARVVFNCYAAVLHVE